ncbi:hypothetical protein HUJ04_002296 [Dendroctonus ponderosae]|nr:hypothetical protein HUJ04_002296 [Dendroctonus ponderosae]
MDSKESNQSSTDRGFNQPKISENRRSSLLTDEEISAEVCHLAGNPTYCKIIQAALKMDNQANIPTKNRMDLSCVPTKQYLDQTVVPILMSGLCYLSKERPPEPIIALAEFLIKNKDQYEEKRGGDKEPKSQASSCSRLFSVSWLQSALLDGVLQHVVGLS